MRKGWKRAKAYGVEQRFIPSDGSEETWTAIMLDLLKWEEEQDLIEPWESTREK